MNISWNLYNDSSVGRLTQFGQPNAPSANAQNGSPAAQVIKVGLGDGGKILAGYSDGSQVTVGQVAMAAVRNPDSLVAVGNNNYQLSAKSATPAIGVAGHRRPRLDRGRRARKLERRYRHRIHQHDRAAARLRGQRQSGDDGGSIEPGHHQPGARLDPMTACQQYSRRTAGALRRHIPSRSAWRWIAASSPCASFSS